MANIKANVVTTANINVTDELFTSYINFDVAAKQAAYSLRETAVMTVISNTSVRLRVDENFYSMLIQEAKLFSDKNEIKLYRDDKYIKMYTFMGNQQQVFHELQRFFAEVIVGYRCYWEDSISYDERNGFCWEYDGMKIAIV